MGYEGRTWKTGNVVGFREVGTGDIERSGVFLCENICRFNESGIIERNVMFLEISWIAQGIKNIDNIRSSNKSLNYFKRLV